MKKYYIVLVASFKICYSLFKYNLKDKHCFSKFLYFTHQGFYLALPCSH